MSRVLLFVLNINSINYWKYFLYFFQGIFMLEVGGLWGKLGDGGGLIKIWEIT